MYKTNANKKIFFGIPKLFYKKIGIRRKEKQSST